MKNLGIKGKILSNRYLKRVIQPGKLVKDFLVGVYVYLKYQNRLSRPADKAVFLDIKNNVYNRYLYLLVKFFHLQGYHVFLKAHPVTLRYIFHSNQPRLIIQEKLATFTLQWVPGCQLYLSDSGKSNRLSADYFSDLVQCSPRKSDYYVPMAMHPRMYKEGWWQEEHFADRRYRSVFFAGNANRDHYSIPEKDNLFSVIDRIKLYDLLVRLPMTFEPKSMEELEENSGDHQVIMVTKQHFVVPMAKLRPVLANYAFFLACPGYIMPFSHNVVEAMSVGTIPIIQSKYASLFQPTLEHGINALLFDDQDSLVELIHRAFMLEEEHIARISRSVLSYYKQHLTPERVVNNLLAQEYRHVFLVAELPSVELLKKNIRKNPVPPQRIQDPIHNLPDLNTLEGSAVGNEQF